MYIVHSIIIIIISFADNCISIKIKINLLQNILKYYKITLSLGPKDSSCATGCTRRALQSSIKYHEANQ
jgi:hypothetical protein